MIDREKVIKGLECCMKWTGEPDTATCHCSDCSYTNMDILGQRCLIDLINDALALLKEQEAKTGHWIEDETETYTENHDTWECSECHEPFTLTEGTPEENKFYFCPRCGAKMEFEGR